MRPARSMRCARGFTLLELVVSIAVSGIVLAFAGMFVKAPLDAYMASARRSEIQDSVSILWPRMEEDIRSALPNSVRVTASGTSKALELLPVLSSARFMSSPNGGSFKTAGILAGVPHSPSLPPPAGLYYLSINNASPNDAYAMTNVMTSASRQLTFTTAGTEDTVAISPAFNFAAAGSPTNRIYLVQRPVTYLCNETAGTLQRFSGYTVAASQASRNTAAKLTAAGAAVSLIARDIKSCAFSFVGGNTTHGQIVTARITVAKDGETTSIVRTASVDKLQ
jgi:MSHA biogenesis protein MshO